MPEDWRQGGFGLYVHWPFCQSKCPYCDFNSHVTENVDQKRWQQALTSEIERYAEMVPDRILNTMFFGGGTPSLMDPDVVDAVIDCARRAWPTSNDMEITLEANPTSVEAGRFKAYRDAGINRISMGVQALNDSDLKALGRLHSVAEARTAFDIARTTFDRVSFDLIYARQEQTASEWESELKTAIGMAVDHLSLYQLTIEDGTAFADRFAKGGLAGLPDDDRAADLYDLTQNLCEAAGLACYEISNHARPGSESRHNLTYWRYGDYVGIGPGAHGRITNDGKRYATEAIREPGAWLASVEDPEKMADRADVLSGKEQAAEFLMMGLRLREGVSLSRYQKLNDAPLNPTKIKDLTESGHALVTGDRLAVTERGRPLLNAVLRDLLTD